jgi:hypothetical protein
MNEHDKRNLRFLLGLGKIGLMRFLAQASEDDMLYAAELLNKHKAEMEKNSDMYENRIYEYVSQDDFDVDNCTEAKEYLSKFRLNK